MTKNNFLKTLALSAVLFLGTAVQAQVKVGDNPTTINANSIFEMESTSKGMLLPRLALTNTTATSPLAAHVAGMTVYNSATAGDVTPGFYYNDGAKWVRIMGAPTGSTGAQNTTAGTLMTITNGAGATMTAMTVAVDTSAMKSFISQAVQNGAITGKNTTAGSLITVTNGAGATLTAMTLAVDTTAMKSFIANSVNSSPIKDSLNKLIANSTADTSKDHWQNNGTSTYTTTGNVGIGTSAPTDPLHIKVGSDNAKIGGDYITFDRPTFSYVSNTSATGILSFGTNGINTHRMVITPTGNVGIGTSAPTTKLDVAGNAKITTMASGSASDSMVTVDATGLLNKRTVSSVLGGISPSAIAKADTSNDSWFESGANTVDTTGNVGIGTTTPFSKLQVNTTETGFTSLSNLWNETKDLGLTLLNNTVNTGTDRAVGIKFLLSTNASPQAAIVASKESTTASYMAFYTQPANSSVLERLRITANGNVGIGTTTPVRELEILSVQNNGAQIRLSSGTGTTGWSGIEGITSGGNTHFGVFEGNGRFFVDGGSNGSEDLVVLTNGNVGIGTTTPEEKLHVTGKTLLTNGFSSNNGALLYKKNTDYLFIGPSSGTTSDGAALILLGNNNTSSGLDSGSIGLNTPVGGSYEFFISGTTGNVGIGTTTPGSKLAVVGLPVYADNTAAASLSVGDFYRTATGQVMVKY